MLRNEMLLQTTENQKMFQQKQKNTKSMIIQSFFQHSIKLRSNFTEILLKDQNYKRYFLLFKSLQYRLKPKKMSTQVDFVTSNYQNFSKIIRPTSFSSKPSSTKKQPSSSNANSSKTFTIEKSFIPDNKPLINDAIAPQLKQLKQFYKRKIQHEKKLKQLFAQGIIQKEEMEGKAKRQETVVAKDQSQKVKVDQSGQLRDEKGNLLFVRNQTASLIINKRIVENEKLKELNKKQRIKFHEKLTKNLQDRNLVVMAGNKRRIKRSRLGLQFLQKGSYQSVSALAHEVKVQQVQNLSDIFKQQNPQQQRIIIKKRSRTTLRYDRDIPDIQWWDKLILNGIQSYDDILKDCDVNVEEEQDLEGKINTIKIEDYFNINQFTDEVRYQKVGDQNMKDENIMMPMYLTKDERKKLKRKKKKEKLMEKNDMVKLGLIQPEKPKLRVGNMAIVMKNQFILDPSKVQAEAKQQQQQRLSKHLQTNSSRKLTKKQRQQKQIRKLKKDSAKQCRRVVFKIGKLDNSSQIFKINMNAKQLALNGFIIKPKDYHRQIVMVAAEGGAKAIKFYKNLMLNRIKWEQDQGNKCVLVWEGLVDNTTLGKWKTFEVGDQSETVKILKQKNVQFFWDYVAN